jgi:alanine dehydrogenase
MIIGVPKEIKTLEHRVGLVPSSVVEFVRSGHAVLIESGAGEAINFTDDIYPQRKTYLTAPTWS